MAVANDHPVPLPCRQNVAIICFQSCLYGHSGFSSGQHGVGFLVVVVGLVRNIAIKRKMVRRRKRWRKQGQFMPGNKNEFLCDIILMN